MNASKSFWQYDLFKLLVTLILLIVLLLGFSFYEPPPKGSGGVDIATFTPAAGPQDENQEPSTPEVIEEPELPPFPPSPVTLTPDDTHHYLLAPEGSAVYVLDDENRQWKPVVPQEILTELQGGYTLLQSDPAGWTIQSSDGQTLFSWDEDQLVWNAVQSPQPASSGGCPVLLPPRLQVGGKARVLFNLNMRSSPGIKDNWMLTNPSRTELKVLSGPVCVAQEGGVYWWWEVENPSGLRGWSAEAHQQGIYYFLEPFSP